MTEPGWLTFYTAAREVERQLGCSQAVAQINLREACAAAKIRSMKAPYHDLNQTSHDELRQIPIDELPAEQSPIEFWTRIAPREWREREVDYDGPDADGCAIEVMINEQDFRHWQNEEPKPLAKASLKRDVVQQAINSLWPTGVPSALLNKQVETQVAEWLTAYWKRENLPKEKISRDTILRAARRK